MSTLRRTELHDRHVALGADLAPFAGWEMPIRYPTGIVDEHLATRGRVGVFDISHMGRFTVRGDDATAFLQHVLTSNVQALDLRDVGAQYTLIATPTGGAVDDAFLYRFCEAEYLLVVNAANAARDWAHLVEMAERFEAVELIDDTSDVAMLALQGPDARRCLARFLGDQHLPEPMRNAVTTIDRPDGSLRIARTGYTGEPICFELFLPTAAAGAVWDALVDLGAVPCGLGARDTLRLEAGLPLYGHELGIDAEGREVPALACRQSKFGVSFSPLKGDYVGREALERQFRALGRIGYGDFSDIADLPRMVRPVAIVGPRVARQGAPVYQDGQRIGTVTSGTRVPLWLVEGEGLSARMTHTHGLRSICLAYIDSQVQDDDRVSVEIRGKRVDAIVVPHHLRTDAPPYARPIVFDHVIDERPAPTTPPGDRARDLLAEAAENTAWRQRRCINLIPSEMTASPAARFLSIADPACRYAEHKKMKAFYDTDIFYYQGTEFIREVEERLAAELVHYLGCAEAETRVLSGQMANTAVFSAMVDYINMEDRKREPRRMRCAMNHYLGKGGHLSSQPMGALRDFVARDPVTERPAVINFPVLIDNPFRMDVDATCEAIDRYRPELVIFGKSMILHREPVADICRFLEEQDLSCVVMYDMAHVLGLLGPHFQEPFAEGADFVTGSTHKTYFGTQRGVIGSPFDEHDPRYKLWEAVQRRTFPGSVSNHHLGTMVGLLMAAYEMNAFRNDYQPAVIANARAFARALSDAGLHVLGDSAIDFTETHQVVVDVGYGRGPAMAARLEDNNIICNFQAAPDEEGFTASGALRMGVSEMTRFGMDASGFSRLAELIRDVVVDDADVASAVEGLRGQYATLRYCFTGADFDRQLERLHGLL